VPERSAGNSSRFSSTYSGIAEQAAAHDVDKASQQIAKMVDRINAVPASLPQLLLFYLPVVSAAS